ncbi:MAG: Glu/Leu/Phe/Val dehydrogenase dimerization domain-containing protein [Halovenus sp.]
MSREKCSPGAGRRGAVLVAIHDTTLGPALGGTRVYDYESEAAALEDVARLSRAMTYKAAVADLDLGGGKAVIVGDPETIKDTELFAAYGRAVDSLAGRYVSRRQPDGCRHGRYRRRNRVRVGHQRRPRRPDPLLAVPRDSRDSFMRRPVIR